MTGPRVGPRNWTMTAPHGPAERHWLAAWAALGAGLALASLAASNAYRWEREIVAVAVGETFLAAGAALHVRRGRARAGGLLAAAGVCWFLQGSPGTPGAAQPLASALAALAAGLCQVLVAHVAVALPAGRPRSRPDRAVVACWLAYFAYAEIVLVLLYAGPAARLDQVAHATGIAFSVVLAGMALATMGWRWRVSGAFERRRLGPALWSYVPLTAVEVGSAVAGPQALPPLLSLGALAFPLAILLGLLRAQLDHAAVGRLVVELGESTGSNDLQRALSRTVHDPALTLAYWRPEPGEYVDSEGRRVRLSGPDRERGVTVLHSGAERLAALVHDPALALEPELIEASAATARLAIENGRLQAQVRERLEEVRASRARIVEAADAERRRIERNLHDGAQQRLVTLSLDLTLLRAAVRPDLNPALDRCLERAARELETALDELRELARGIHPAILREAGLGPALESLTVRSPVPAKLSSLLLGRLPAPVEATAYFVVAEALANAARHSGASAVSVQVERTEDGVAAEVADDGRGGADPALGSGLQGIADRVGAMSGRLEVVSPAGGGTAVRVFLPAPLNAS